VTKQRVIIDCDPGQDDAVNLLLALAPGARLEVLGITAVAGNVPLALTERNARLMCDVAGRSDVPVYAGCAKPLTRELITAENVHGRSGIDGIEIVEPKCPLQPQHAVDYLVASLRDAEADSITLVPTGPLTNIAAAIQREPGILKAVNRIVLMGGAMREAGNTTPSAEFNILVDPHAAKIVFGCGKPLTVFGLDVTHQVLASRERVANIRAIDTAPAQATAGMLEFFSRFDSVKYGADGAPLHDPCTIAFLLAPELFEAKACNIEIETESLLTMGHTAVDFWGVSGRAVNADWVYKADADGFYELLSAQLASY
jgi:inosine-uridine nucleoside N-ribohydrolase